ncbi:MAG: hypothetical protein E6L03_03690 [Thaumarchaeota archaeon]|nr:MAG: hypothetical protein E6L03_03690 [Nitrososphaerota archaeon]
MKFERMLFFVLSGMTLAVMMYFGMESNNIFAITIKIESPLSNQQVPVGELTITGTSSDNSTSECQVYVDWNSLKPYQLATPTGTNGSTDFSKWSYTYSSKYHLIQTGLNDLTSKITCLVPPTGPTVTKWYSINVTGSTSTNQSNIVQLPLPTANNNSPPSSNILTSTPQLDTSINTTNSSSSNQINLDISVEQNPIPAGEKQRVTLTASDPATGNTLDRVFLRLTIKDPSGNILKDYTDNDGELSPTFKINKDVTGTYSILASASQAGVETSKSSTFVVQ